MQPEVDPLLKNVPPHSADAERAVLGALLIDPSSIDDVAVLVTPDHFYRPAHALIYSTVLELWRGDKPVDVVLLNEELAKRNVLEQVGGTAALAELTEAVPTAANAPYYAKIIRDHAARRDLIRVTAEVQKDAFDISAPTEELLDRTEKRLFEVTQQRIRSEAVPVATVVEEAFRRLKQLKDGQGVAGLPSGFVDLDELTQGFQPGEMTIVAARPSMGKTSFCLNILRNITVYQGRPAVFFSLEMPRLQVTSNILCSLARIDGHRLRGGYLTREEERQFLDAAEILAPAPLFIDDTPGLSTMELRAKVRRLKAQHDIGFVVIDYLQLMSGSDRTAQESRQQEVSEISRMIKALARELHIPIMALAQLSRKVEERKDHKPMMSDLRESGCLAGDTLVTLADSGRRVPIRELEGRTGFDVWALNTSTYRLERAPVSAAFCTGVKPVFRLTTRLGRTIRATSNHRFFTIDGWRRLDELNVCDRIATPRTLESPATGDMTGSELALLGHLIGDGCTLARRSVQYTTTDEDLADVVMRLATERFGGDVRPHMKRERTWIQVYLPTSRKVTHGVRNPVCEWLDDLGVFDLRSHEKFVPARVFEQPSSEIARFLRHLWATDGCIHVGRSAYPAVYYATSSRQLAADVQALLLRVGICATVRRVPQRRGRDQHHVVVSGHGDLVRFADQVGAVGERKVAAMENVRRVLTASSANTNRDVVPASVWTSLVKPAMRERGVTDREFQASIQTAYCGSSLYRQNMGRDRAARVAAVLDLEPLAALATSGLYWDEIVAIEPDGEERVYDLTVPDLHSFVANELVVHNSIEQDADLIMLLFRPEYYEPGNEELKNKAEVIVAKNRNGPVGEVKMAFFNSHMRFESLTKM